MKMFFILLFFCIHLQATTIRIPDLSLKSIEALKNYQIDHPGPLTVKIEGEISTLQALIEYGEKFVGKADTVAGQMDSLGLFKPILQWAVGGTMASYGAGFYLIYRAYKLLRTIGSWTSAANQHNEEELVLCVRRTQKKAMQQKYLKEIREEKEVLAKYLKIHVYLCRWHMRKLFLYDRASHRSIVKSYNRLCSLEGELCN